MQYKYRVEIERTHVGNQINIMSVHYFVIQLVNWKLTKVNTFQHTKHTQKEIETYDLPITNYNNVLYTVKYRDFCIFILYQC